MKEQGLFGQEVIAQLLFGLMSFSFRSGGNVAAPFVCAAAP